MIALLLATLVACSGGDKADTAAVDDTGPGPTPDECDGDTLLVEVGTGAEEYLPLADGEAVTLVHGPQGGWHILGSVWIGHTDPIVAIHYTVTTEAEGVVISDNRYTVQLVADGECSGYFPGMYGYISVGSIPDVGAATPPEVLDGDAVILKMEAEDEAGRTGEGQIRVIVALDPEDAAP